MLKMCAYMVLSLASALYWMCREDCVFILCLIFICFTNDIFQSSIFARPGVLHMLCRCTALFLRTAAPSCYALWT